MKRKQGVPNCGKYPQVQTGLSRNACALKEVVERIDMLYSRENPDEVTGVSIGFIDLDKTSGLQPAI